MAEPSVSTDSPTVWDGLLDTKLHRPGLQPGFVPRRRLVDRLEESRGRPAGAGVRAGRVRQDLAAGRLGRPEPLAGRLAVAGRGRQRPGPVLASRGRRAGPSSAGDRASSSRRCSGPAPASFEGLRDGADQRAGRAAGPAAAGPGRLPPDRRPAGARLARRSCSSTGRPRCAWCWPAAPTRRCRWPGCAARGQLAELRAAELRFTAEEAAALLHDGGQRRAARRLGGGAGRRGPRAGRPGCSWRRCRCAVRPTSPGSWPPSPAATATCSTTWPRRCWTASRSQLRAFLLETSVLERLSAARCATRSPAAPTARRCWSRWSGPTCSWCRWTTCGGWWRYHHLFADLLRVRLQQEQPGEWPCCTVARPPGHRPTGWPTTPSGTRWRRGRPAGPAAWSSVISTDCCCAASG